MDNKVNRKLILEDGSEYYGVGFGDNCDRVCEIVFNTSVVGYQEILSDPSYANQLVVMTYPLIGNYGITDDDFETKNPSIGGLVVREYNDSPSNFRYTRTLAEILEENDIPAISGIDTRMLTRSIRDNGSCKALITDVTTTKEEGLKILKATDLPVNDVAKVSCKKRWYSRTTNPNYNVLAIDCGIKHNIIRSLNQRRCNVTVVPWNTDYETIKAIKPDGILISNGPGNPKDVMVIAELIKQLRGKYPIFGCGLGHQLIALSYGADTYKLKSGHHGGYAVKNLITDKIEMTSQNHNYAVDADSIKGTDLTVTHVNIPSGTIAGLLSKKDKCFSVQYQPESAPGPQDSGYIFDMFIDMIKEGQANA